MVTCCAAALLQRRFSSDSLWLVHSVVPSLMLRGKWDSAGWWVWRRSCRSVSVNIIKRTVPVVHSEKTIKTDKDRSSIYFNWSHPVLITAQVSIFIVKWSLAAAAASLNPKRCSVDAPCYEMYFWYLLLLLWSDIVAVASSCPSETLLSVSLRTYIKVTWIIKRRSPWTCEKEYQEFSHHHRCAAEISVDLIFLSWINKKKKYKNVVLFCLLRAHILVQFTSV